MDLDDTTKENDCQHEAGCRRRSAQKRFSMCAENHDQNVTPLLANVDLHYVERLAFRDGYRGSFIVRSASINAFKTEANGSGVSKNMSAIFP